MENFYSRNRNPIVLVALVFAQVIALATQVKRADPAKPSGDKARLLRVWVIEALAPPERLFVRVGGGARNLWHAYVALHNTNQENTELQQEVNGLRAERVRLSQEAQRTQELERLFGFKEQYASKTVAAQVIGSSGTDLSHVLYIDKGERNGLKPEMAVVTPDGIVGKVREVYPTSAQVLLLNDQQSGVGVLLEKSRRQGVMKGSASGILEVHYVMSDEKVEAGEKVYTSGGDRIFPKGLEVGEVIGSVPDKERDGFQVIRVRPNANLFRLEEVLVVTKMEERVPESSAADAQQPTNAEMLAARLPGIDPKAVETVPKVDANGKAITPPPIRPAKALLPDRFSPPEERVLRRGASGRMPDATTGKMPVPPAKAPQVKVSESRAQGPQ
ncbi:MAG: rod shape-determining protein MreC [Acidobacteriaceae bacterium]